MSNELAEARTALINDVLTAYHTTRLLETPAATHILSKGFVQDAFARLAEAERTAAIAAAVGDWPGDDTDALNLLAGAGYGCKAGMIYPKEPGGDESVMVCAAINYLCSEWDYGYAPSRAALERTGQ